MIQKMFCIYDAKAETFNVPFYAPTHGEAERSFRQACNDERTMMNKFPSDFDLYFLGDYDTQHGKFVLHDTPQHVIKAIQCVQKDTTPKKQAVPPEH